MGEKTQAQLLKEKLFNKSVNASKVCDTETFEKAALFAEDYKRFINIAKTEREFTELSIEDAKKKGFVEFKRGNKYSPGDKIYSVNRGKALMLAIIGQNPVSEGLRIAAAHIDSPRLDLKPEPVYESDEIAYFKTHYYGGIKKYQWTAVPLSLHGVVMLKNGESVTVKIGEDDNDPRFCVTDLLPHLASEQMKKNLSDAIPGESLNTLIGSYAYNDEKESDLVKLNILNILNDKYGITEKDFLSAELELVPAFKASDIGFDRSMIGAYGHDDRICAYPELRAALDFEGVPENTFMAILADKEEVGSEGNTGMNSAFLQYFIEDLAEMQGVCARDAFSNSQCLSADVNAAFDPNFPDVYEKRNSSFLNHGVCVTKYTGARGKSGTSDASAEFMSKVRTILDRENVLWQSGELGKIDAGGGGTVAQYIAKLNVDVVDVGVPVLSMHSPFEVVSKIDLYMMYLAVAAFMK